MLKSGNCLFIQKKTPFMKYSKIQKFISSFVLFSLLFGITFRVPFFNYSTYAGSSDFFNLVSIIVDEDSYWKIDSELKRYAQDIQGVLENTKVVILPTPKNTDAFNIASLNESLYYEWYKSIDDSVDFESKLIWTVLVWDFNLPIVFDGTESSKTIVPFTDFEDKVYIYNHENNKYEKNEKGSGVIKSEIWHWVISPNLWDFDKNIKGFKNYFDKNHDFYSGTWNFKFSEWILNGNKNIWVPSTYEPYVFYHDQFRETKSMSYNSFKAYEWYLENLEDIVYNRFSAELANKLAEKSLSESNESMLSRAETIVNLNKELWDSSPFSWFNEDFAATLTWQGPDTNNIPDIQTRHIIENATKKFIEIFSKWTLWEFRKEVHNAWRYNEWWSEVNVDLIPSLVTVIDVVYSEMLKDVSNELEDDIDKLVKNWLSRNIAIATKIVDKDDCGTVYENYVYWKKADTIKSASECSIYRGTTENWWKLVEANRWLNIGLINSDMKKIENEDGIMCEMNIVNGKALNWWWGWNSPLNISMSSSSQWMIDLKNNDLQWSITPIFNIGGSKQIFDSSKIPSPLNCFEDNFILSEENSLNNFNEENSCAVTYRLPTSWDRINWTCLNDNNAGLLSYGNTDSFIDIYNYMYEWNAWLCDRNYLNLDWVTIISDIYVDRCDENIDWSNEWNINCDCTEQKILNQELEDWESRQRAWTDYFFKKIPSFVIHKSPDEYELKEEIKTMTTPSLPVDKVRYIDFVSPTLDKVRIDYPYLFWIIDSIKWEKTFETISQELDKYLNQKSKEINNIIKLNNPKDLSWNDLELYNIFKTWNYPKADVDLLKSLKEENNTKLNSISWTKKMSHYDTLVFALYWQSLKTLSAKYAFVFDYFLNDQLSVEDQKYFLPLNKKEYEIAYIWAKWDSQNMYIKMDPEWKADNIYADTISNNIKLSSSLLASNIWPLKSDEQDSKQESALFECSPPDWVPLREWIPAVMCRLWDMLPPTISLSDSNCWASLLFDSEDFNFGNDDDDEEVFSCEWDSNRNWINDCIEKELWNWWTLELSSDSEKYYYNTNAWLKSVIKDRNWKIIKSINDAYVYFELQKIEEAKNKDKLFTDSNTKVVYEKYDINNNDESVISDYINFKEAKVRSNAWISNYMVWSKFKEVNIYLKAYIKNNNSEDSEILMESETLKIEVRWNRLFNSSYKLENKDDGLEVYNWVNSLKVSNKNNIILVDWTNKNINQVSSAVANSSISKEKIALFVENISVSGERIPLSYPLTVTLLEWKKEIDKLSVSKTDLNIFKSLFSIKKSWSYTIEIVDSEWYKTIKNIELIPEIPNYIDIELSTSVMQTGWNVSTNFITLYDEYSNLTTWKFYDIELDIDWNWVEFLDNEADNLKTSTFEWYKIFRLKSTDNEWDNKINVKISDIDWNEIIKSSRSIDVLDKINLSIRPLSGDIKVWGGTYKYEVSLRNEDGTIINDFNSRAYLIANPIFLEAVNPYVKLVNWTAEIEFKTKTVAWKNIPVEFQVEWLSQIVKREITIYPAKPLKIDLILSQSEIEASDNSYSTLNVELKDRYNNLVFNDNTTNTSLEILDQYSGIITSDKGSSIVKEWKTTYKIYSTLTPWIAHFKVTTNPSLYTNSFVVEDANWKVVVNWVWENAWKIETFYFWNKSKIEWKSYNSIYTTLLWANYWDITEQDYLAWSLLFERDNRALAVTSLLNTPFKYSNILKLDQSWLLSTINSPEDLSQDIKINTKFINNKLALDIYNKSLNIYVWDVFYNFDDNTKLIACESDNNECVSETETSINLKSLSEDYDVYLDWDKLILRNKNWNVLLEIQEDGTVNRLWVMDFEYDNENESDNLLINIKKGGTIIAKLWFNFVDAITNISRDTNIFNSKIGSVKNSILVLVKTNSYWTYDYWNLEDKSKIFYFNDPFDSENALNTFTKSNIYWYENFVNQWWIWWSESNKSLLAFSAWKTVWESVQDYMSFSVVNLWDPVISLKKIEKKLPSTNTDRKFDATIWKLLSSDSDISWYHVFDYDNDSIDDILLVKDNNYLKLLENKQIEWRFVDKWNLAYIVDLWSLDLVWTWDFTWDWYDDIFFVDNEWDPYLLNNINKNFTRYSLIDKFNLDWRILIAKVFDMDNDWLDDVVTLDDSWEINIFYWKGTSAKPDFTRLTLSENNWVYLSNKIRNDGSLIYFKWIYQPLESPSDNAKMDNLLYFKYPYFVTEQNITYDDVLSWDIKIEDERPSIYFLKSEYAESVWLKIEKTFNDRNGGFISSSDMVDAKIVLTNVSDRKLKNVVFSEKVPVTFSLDNKSIKSDKLFDLKNGISWYDFLIDGFDLWVNESITIVYEAKVKPIKYSYIDVWLFEKWEIWDDRYWDIIIKKDNKNCGDTVDIYRSLEEISSRTYGKWIIAPACDADKIRLPDQIEKNKIDLDWNWVPDYIDDLTKSDNQTSLKEYSQKELDKLNWDNEDVWPVLNEITKSLESVNNYIEWLSCWFGWAGCIATPLNRAPLAPWNDPVYQWELQWDGLNVDEWLPIFSALTWMYYWPICLPAVWPISPLAQWCSDLWAWGRLWVDSTTNFLRIFVTPTLTWWVWTAICFGWPASEVGTSIPEAVSPLSPGWNCIVLAEKMSFCSDDGSDWDPSSIWIPTYSWNYSNTNSDFWIINWNCSSKTWNLELSYSEADKYLKDVNDWRSAKVYSLLPDMFSESTNNSLFVEGEWVEVSVDLDFAWLENWHFEDIVQIEQKRISAFPSWLMDWVTRQIEEIANKLTDFPTIFIILPDFSWVFDMDWWKTKNEPIDTDNNKINSWIKEAYEFIWSIPLVYVEQETINMTIPWISLTEINKTIASREATIGQRSNEVDRATKQWTLWMTCDYKDKALQEQCKKDNDISTHVSFELISNIDGLINSLRDNLEIIKEYKKIPEKINQLISTKELYLEQILCNIESISNILGWRIWKNGERFKAWVEVYILIKAILKSWQWLVDVFIDYEEECHDCKNERQDALEEEFSLISFIMPTIPVIRFPKWPDIIIDLHNIRAWLRIFLPEFEINTKPIILPTLPALYLPDVPNINLSAEFKLPEIPLLPAIDIPWLPELPSLPSIELPDLPPPPNLPELLSSISVVVEIIKLISEAMCILKSSVFHPEWRAWDQIAFLTERGGYMESDFIEVSPPEFSFPYIDAIKLTTFVNLEFETEYIVELAKQIAMPLNHFSNDFVNIFDIRNASLDFTGYWVPSTSIETEFWYNNTDKLWYMFATRVASNILHLFSVINDRKNNEVDSYSFKQLVNKSLASKTITDNPRLDKIREIWADVDSIDYSKENSLIKELQENNTEKFQAVSDIINTEIIKNKELKEKINNIWEWLVVNKVWYNDSNKVDLYNKTLSVYNDKIKESWKKLIVTEDYNNELKETKDLLLTSIKSPLQKYSDRMTKKVDEKLLTAVQTNNASSTTVADITSCQAQAQSKIDYKYEWIYILEKNTSYRLFDYLDELNWNETTKVIDIDKDGDDDLLYFANWQLFFKENLQEKWTKSYVTTNPLVVKSDNNKFYNKDIFYEAINNAHEVWSPNWRINLFFSSPTDKLVNNFRIGFYTIIDKYLNELDSNYRPEFINKYIVDAIAWIEKVTEIEKNDLFIKRKNLVYIKNVWNLKDVKLKTKKLINIYDNLSQNQVVNILIWTTLYAWWNSFKINYIDEDDTVEKSLIISENENIELQKNIKIVWISWDAYIEWSNEVVYEWMDIINHLNKPLFPWAIISYNWKKTRLLNQSYIELMYYDDSELNIDFDITSSWELYDLWNESSDYYLTVDKENDYYYSKINSFSNNINSTLSKQILLAPQIESDQNPPELSLNSIRVPVYQKYTQDITSYIYEYGWVKNIKKVIVDLDLDKDTNANWNTKDDNDWELEWIYKDKVKVDLSLISLKLIFWEFDSLFKKKIWITLIDSNNNIWYKEVILEVYTPTPTITNFTDWLIEWSINESLSDEPVNLYRYRWWSIAKLENTEWLTKTLTNDWNYSFNVSSKWEWLILYRDWKEVAIVDEYTWKITLKDFALTTKVLSSNSELNDEQYPKIMIQDKDEDIFYEYIKVEWEDKVKVVDNFDGITEKWIYFTLTNKTSYNYYTIPETLDYSPGSVSVYRLTDSTKTWLFTVFNDWWINTLNYNYKLEYENYWNYVMLKIIDSHFNKEIGRVLYVADGEYIMK